MAIDGDASLVRRPWPGGDDSVVPMWVGLGDLVADNEVIQMFIVPFKCTVESVWVGTGTIANTPQLEIVTTETVAQTIVTDAAIPAAAATDPTEMTVADSGPILAGTALKFTLTAAAGETADGVGVTLLLKPTVVSQV